MMHELKKYPEVFNNSFSGCESRPAKVSIPYVTIYSPEDQEIFARMGNKAFKISKRYFAYSTDGVPYETDNVDLPFDK